MRRHLIAALALVSAIAPTPRRTDAQTPGGVTGYYRQPAIHGDRIVFVSEGDLWVVGRDGGIAQRLTTNLAEESNPAISPDGQTIAFTGRYDGVGDVYTIPIMGGTPKRHSWDGGARVVGWAPDGRILYTTARYSTLPNAQLLLVDPGTNDRELLPLAQAYDGDFLGSSLIFTRLSPQGSHTKRYKGGTAQNIWKLPVAGTVAGTVAGAVAVAVAVAGRDEGAGRAGGAGEAVALTADFTGTSRSPRVWNERIYFVSDRDNVMNIWSMDGDGKHLIQHTFHRDYDVRDFSIHNGKLVYQQGPDLWLLDLSNTNLVAKAANPRPADRAAPATLPATATATAPAPAPAAKLMISISSDLDQMRERWVKKPMDFLSDYHIDKTGDRVALIARGVVFVAPVSQGRFIQLPNRGGVRYREMRFAPDGKSLFTLNDRSGEVELWQTPANGVGVGTQLTNDAKILRYDLEPSPDGKYVAHNDKNQRLYVYDVAGKNNKQIAEGRYGGFGYWWSPDSRTVVYTTAAPNGIQVLHLYDVASGTTKPLTTAKYDSYAPAFTPDGAWLYFLSDRTFNTSVGSPWGARQPEPYFNNQTKIYAVQLKRGPRFPFAPKTELDRDTVDVVAGVFEVPIAVGNYSSLATDGKRLYYISREHRFSGEGTRKLMSLEFKNEDVKPETFAEDIRGSFELSGDLKKVLLRKGDDLFVVPAGEKAPKELDKHKVDLSGWLLQLERKDEMKNLFVDAWRLERDYFYDPGMHGVDWAAMKTKYMPLAERVSDRAELSDVIAQMVGELSALHIYVYGGDMRGSSDTIAHASLGAVLEKADGGWRVAHIYRSDPELPGLLSPLAAPGVAVSEGDVITAINGVPLSSVQHPAELLVGKAGKQVLLDVRPGAGGPSRPLVVYPNTLQQEASLRYSEWQLTRRELVDKLSGGRVGYVHLRAMGGDNMNEFQREFYPQYNKQALIVDMRHNRGGNIDSWVLEKLMRRAWFYWQPRVGEPYWNMQYAFRGPMATIVNEWSASDGEAFPEGFRRLGLGKIVGTRTWGGEIWLSSSNVLADRGIATAAETGVYGPEGQWLIEGHGVDPDVVVDNLPVSTFAGTDAQLEATVKLLLDEVAKRPNPVPRAPVYPKK